MFLRSVFQRLVPASQTRAARRRRGATASYHRPIARQFEPLEDRRVLAVLYAAQQFPLMATDCSHARPASRDARCGDAGAR
jgi:hypothetical protein